MEKENSTKMKQQHLLKVLFNDPIVNGFFSSKNHNLFMHKSVFDKRRPDKKYIKKLLNILQYWFILSDLPDRLLA